MKPGQHGPVDPFDADRFDPRDPDPWLALALDQSIPIDDGAKRALLMGSRSWSRRWLFPVARPLTGAPTRIWGYPPIKASRGRAAVSPSRDGSLSSPARHTSLPSRSTMARPAYSRRMVSISANSDLQRVGSRLPTSTRRAMSPRRCSVLAK